ncbi:MAG: CooT family nickel-binding protein [Candidatus Bathyarchaeia archaeon]|nr:CooT family nickel-binding protein [Candidatus Bathyarchaeota archaeon]
MCEFKVILDGNVIFENVVYVKVNGEKIILKNILGVLKEVKKCKIVEIDVNSERLTLSSI